MSTRVCAECGTPENFPEDTKSELRPYGPGGTDICYRCAFKDEESTKRTEDNFSVIVDATLSAGLPFIITDNKTKRWLEE